MRYVDKHVQPMKLVAQRKQFDCGIACLATYFHLPYEDAYALAIAHIGVKVRRGMCLYELRTLAKKIGRPMTTVHHKKVDLDEDSGILGVNWTKGGGHWVVLRKGTIVDPAEAQTWEAEEYLAVNGGRVGSLLTEA